jgi:hypothetical protein
VSTASSLEIIWKSKILDALLVVSATPASLTDDTEVVPPKSQKQSHRPSMPFPLIDDEPFFSTKPNAKIQFACPCISSRLVDMQPDLQAVEAQAMALSDQDRERLASHLFRTLSPQNLNSTDAEWLAVAEQRYQALKDGSDTGLTEDDFFKALAQ